jgi:nucleoside-diphosphate-sugar epimerase
LRLDYTGIVNIGSGKCYSISDILKIVSSYLQMNCIFEPTKGFDTQYVDLDISKLLSLIGGYTFTSLDDGIGKTIKWHILNRDKI